MGILIKYYSVLEGFQEVPGETSLLFNITNCQNKCVGCHSPFLSEDTGTQLTRETLSLELAKGPFTCVCLMGEGNDKMALVNAITEIERRGLKSAVYCGRDIGAVAWCQEVGIIPTFLKVGSYKEELGPLNKETTNQRMYDCSKIFEDITPKFWKKSL